MYCHWLSLCYVFYCHYSCVNLLPCRFRFLYQVFPGTRRNSQRLLIYAAKTGNDELIKKLVSCCWNMLVDWCCIFCLHQARRIQLHLTVCDLMDNASSGFVLQLWHGLCQLTRNEHWQHSSAPDCSPWIRGKGSASVWSWCCMAVQMHSLHDIVLMHMSCVVRYNPIDQTRNNSKSCVFPCVYQIKVDGSWASGEWGRKIIFTMRA